MDRRGFLKVGLGVGVAAVVLGKPGLGRAAPSVAPAAAPSSAGWSSRELDKRVLYSLGSAGDCALIAGGEVDVAGQPTLSDRVDVYNAATDTWTEAKLAAPRPEPKIVGVGS